MKPFAGFLLIFFVLFILKPSIVSVIEKKSAVSFAKEATEEDDSNEEKKIASFEQITKYETRKKPSFKSSKKRSLHIFLFPKTPIKKINTPPPRKM
jgi:hypothetical protein